MTNIISKGENIQMSLPIKIEEGDSYTITGSGNIAVMQVKKHDGTVQTATLKTMGALQKKIYTQYNPESKSTEERNNTIKKLKKSGLTQVDIAKMLGISQSTVSNVLNK